ncbi:MAG TPA: hypothetical protein VLJ37_11650 [bacterium]|nr:hypothetical protein [bacterium]
MPSPQSRRQNRIDLFLGAPIQKATGMTLRYNEGGQAEGVGTFIVTSTPYQEGKK